MNEKKYQAGRIKPYHGLNARISGPYMLKDGRLKANVSLLDYNKKNLLPSAKQVLTRPGGTCEELDQKIEEQLKELAASCGTILVERAREGQIPELTLETYASVKEWDISRHNKWAGKAESNWNLWKEEICPKFGNIQLADCTSTDALEAAMETIFHRKARKEAYSEKEQKYWIILSDILECAANGDDLLDENPLRAIGNKCRKLASTIASAELARKGLSDEELGAFLMERAQYLSESDNHVASVIQVLTGLTVPELCALDVEDYQKGSYVSWLEITKAYKQPRREEAEMTAMLDTGNAYRKVVCSSVVEELLKRQIKKQRKKVAEGLIIRTPHPTNQRKSVTPLFCEESGARLTPQVYKQFVRQSVGEQIKHGAVLPFTQRGNSLTGDNRPTMSHSDWLRNTTEYYYRNICGMNESEIAALLGVDRRHTFATYYVDWGNELVQLYLKAKIERWQGGMDFLIGKQPDARIQNCQGLVISGTSETGAEVRLHAAHGLTGSVQRHHSANELARFSD